MHFSHCANQTTFLFLKLKRDPNLENGSASASSTRKVSPERSEVAHQWLSRTTVKRLKPLTSFLTTSRKTSEHERFISYKRVIDKKASTTIYYFSIPKYNRFPYSLLFTGVLGFW